jgi:hypothetical protein
MLKAKKSLEARPLILKFETLRVLDSGKLNLVNGGTGFPTSILSGCALCTIPK